MKERSKLIGLGVSRKIKLKRTLKKYDMRMWLDSTNVGNFPVGSGLF
jgi:hypothetical protein